MSEKIVAGSTTPSRKQIALQLTCAIFSNPEITGQMEPLEAGEQALVLLNQLEFRLKVAQTTVRPTD